MTVLKTGIASLTTAISAANNNSFSPVDQTQTGIVCGIITTPNTPNTELYKSNGGEAGMGTIFYLPYTDINKNKSIKDIDLSKCTPAKPLFSFIQDYPLEGEIVLLFNAPSANSQNTSPSQQVYYLPSINLWNNSQQNSPLNDKWKTFIQNEDIRNLLSFEGDRIFQGRKGNGIRFGTTVRNKLGLDLNEWSTIGKNGDPITIMVNGYITTNTGSLNNNVEEINKELSSIYLTSTQKLPLIPGASIVNPKVNTTLPKDYNSSQFIANSDRITLNAKKDEVLLFAKGNIELNSDNIININAGRVAHINSPSINLGIKADGSYPTEPVILGGQMMYAFDILIGALSNLASSLTTASTKDGPVVGCTTGAKQLFVDLQRLCTQLEKCTSTNVHTI